MSLREKAQILNQMFRTQNKDKIMEIMASPDIEAILKVEDENKYTPFFSACINLSDNLAMEIVPMMLQKGANPYKIDKYLENVLYYISKLGKDKLLKLLLERYKYDLNSKDENEQTPLFFAASQNHLKCAQLLITHGCNVNHLDKNIQNCLFWAAGGGHLDMCKLLVNHGANFQQIDCNKETAFHYARKKKHMACQAYLQSLKQNAKSRKQMAKMESSQQESKGPRKKKELMKQEYCLIYTSEKGEVHELTIEQLEQFGATNQSNKRILDLIYRPQKLQSYPIPEERRYEKIANKILSHFMKHQQGSIFLLPVDPVALNIPHYPNIVKHPMDFTTIKTKLSYNAYDSEADFNADMNLVFDNCVLFNGRESSYGKIATQMRLQFNTMYKKQFGI